MVVFGGGGVRGRRTVANNVHHDILVTKSIYIYIYIYIYTHTHTHVLATHTHTYIQK